MMKSKDIVHVRPTIRTQRMMIWNTIPQTHQEEREKERKKENSVLKLKSEGTMMIKSIVNIRKKKPETKMKKKKESMNEPYILYAYMPFLLLTNT